MPELSIIIPVMNEERNIKPLYNQLKKVLKKSYEIIFVENGSTNFTFSKL